MIYIAPISRIESAALASLGVYLKALRPTAVLVNGTYRKLCDADRRVLERVLRLRLIRGERYAGEPVWSIRYVTVAILKWMGCSRGGPSGPTGAISGRLVAPPTSGRLPPTAAPAPSSIRVPIAKSSSGPVDDRATGLSKRFRLGLKPAAPRFTAGFHQRLYGLKRPTNYKSKKLLISFCDYAQGKE